jgi:phosphatidylglycerol:prolipoprotein diacylglycerol transferase
MRPTLIEIAGFPIRSFGLMVLLGFSLALWYASVVARRRMKGRKLDEPGVITPDHVFDMSLVGLFVSIAGARILYVLLIPGEFRQNPWDVFKVWSGGISVHGAILAGILYLWWYCRRHKLNFREFADLGAPAFALGYAVGRIGCFLNGCCYGTACDQPWATRFLANEHSGQWTPPSHPTQIYAALMNLLIFGALHLWNSRPHPRGAVFLGYLALYSVYRFIDEIFRAGATSTFWRFGLTHAQAFSLATIPVILFFLYRLYARARAPETGMNGKESAESV